MSRTELAEFVTAEREQLLEGKESIDDAVVTFARRAQPVAVGLLALGDVEAARDWFDALTEEWLVDADNQYDAKYRSEPVRSAQLGPWDAYINALYCTILGREDIEETAKTVLDRATEPFVDDLENRSLAHRIDLSRALTGYLLDTGEVEEHLSTLETNVRDHDKPWALDRYLPYARLLRGLDAESASEVSAGIEGLVAFHRDHVAGARDADTVQKAVALDASAMLALARREGIAVTADYDTVPDPLNDTEYYPVC